MPPITINLMQYGDQEVEVMRLADALEQLSAELAEAQRRAKENPAPDLLKVKDCTVELAVTWEKTGEGGIEWKVINLSGGVTKTDASTVTVVMEPIDQINPGLQT